MQGKAATPNQRLPVLFRTQVQADKYAAFLEYVGDAGLQEIFIDPWSNSCRSHFQKFIKPYSSCV